MDNTKVYTEVYSDASGIWCINHEGNRYGIEWNDIYKVSAYKSNLPYDPTNPILTLELDFEYGEYITIESNWTGFEDVAQAITEHLPEINPQWLTNLKQLEPDQSLDIWGKRL